MDWYYVESGQQMGPVDDAGLARLQLEGRVSAATLVWRAGMTDWLPFEQVQATGGGAPTLANEGEGRFGQQACVQCGTLFAEEEMIRFRNAWVCAACKPQFFQRLKEGGALPSSLVYAGFWIRFAARFIDGIISWVVQIFVSTMLGLVWTVTEDLNAQLAMQAVLFVFSLAFGIAYETWFLGKFGATPGKMALGLQVVRADGSPLSYGRACGRYFGTMLSGFVLCIGYIMAAFDEEKRALHDRICDTRVIRKSRS